MSRSRLRSDLAGAGPRRFIDEGASTPAFDAITADLPKQKGQDVALEGQIDAADLLPARKSTVYRYTGSLTTPPCTAGVTFTVYDKPISLSKQQIGAFTAIYDHHARPVQPLNGRDVRSGAAAAANPLIGLATGARARAAPDPAGARRRARDGARR